MKSKWREGAGWIAILVILLTIFGIGLYAHFTGAGRMPRTGVAEAVSVPKKDAAPKTKAEENEGPQKALALAVRADSIYLKEWEYVGFEKGDFPYAGGDFLFTGHYHGAEIIRMPVSECMSTWDAFRGFMATQKKGDRFLFWHRTEWFGPLGQYSALVSIPKELPTAEYLVPHVPRDGLDGWTRARAEGGVFKGEAKTKAASSPPTPED